MAGLPGQRRLAYRGRNVRVDFKPDAEGIQRIALGPELQEACHRLVEDKALPYAIGIAPVSDRLHQHYILSFHVADVVTGLSPEAIGKPPMLRVGSRLINTAEHAAAVEWGTHENGGRGHHVLRRTLEYLSSLGHDHN